MYHKTSLFLFLFLLFVGLTQLHQTAFAQEPEHSTCSLNDPHCMLENVLIDIITIDNQAWKDQSLHDVASQYSKLGEFDKAIKLIEQITTDDLKAKTIRSIGMSVKGRIEEKSERAIIFTALHVEAKKIKNPAAYATALKNVAISEAYSGDHDDALKKVSSIENQAFRNKAYADVGEIEAMYGEWTAAQESLEAIDNQSVKSKAYETIAKTLADRALLEPAYNAALQISNSYQKTQAILYILKIQQNSLADTANESRIE